MVAPWRKSQRLLLFIVFLACLTSAVHCFSGGKSQLAPALSAAEIARLAGEGNPLQAAARSPAADDAIVRRLQLSVAYLNRTLDDARGCLPFFRHEIGDGTASLAHANWDWCDISSRYALALLKAGDVLGSLPDRDHLVRLQKTILGTLTHSGLAFRPHSEFSDVEADFFDQGSVMLYLIERFRRTGSYDFSRLIDKMIESLSSHGGADTDYWVASSPTILPDGTRGPGAENWDHADPCHHGGRLLFPLALYLRQFPVHGPAKTLFARIARQVISRANVFKPDGSFAGHSHSRTNTLLGLLLRARDTYDVVTEQYVRRSVDWLVGVTPRWGWVPEFMPENGTVRPENTRAETDGLVDLISLLLVLAEKTPDYWDVVDRYVRNGLLAAQFAATWNGPASPDGAFCGFCQPNAFGSSTMNCCSPAGAGLLADLYHVAVTKTGNEYLVNLLLDRDAPDVQIGTELRGARWLVKIRTKRSGGLAIRLPAFATSDNVRVAGAASPAWQKGLIRLGELPGGAEVTLDFDLPASTETLVVNGVNYRYDWLGNIVVGVKPIADRFGFFTVSGVRGVIR